MDCGRAEKTQSSTQSAKVRSSVLYSLMYGSLPVIECDSATDPFIEDESDMKTKELEETGEVTVEVIAPEYFANVYDICLRICAV